MDVSMRFSVVKGSQSAHCCFYWTVVDTEQPVIDSPGEFAQVCECFEEADARLLANLLNLSLRPSSAEAAE